jgi:hypothetical protein
VDGSRGAVSENQDLNIQIKTDFAGQIAKSAILRNVPRAFKANATDWAGDTILAIKRSYKGGNVFKRPPKELDANLTQKVYITGPEAATIVLGTGGYVGKNSVIYADIQERGGVTHPLVTPAMRKWAWAMYFKEFKGAIKGLGLRGATKRGAFETYKGMDSKYKAIALTKKTKLTVTLKATHWFTTPIDARRPLLDMAMRPETVWATAQAMSQGYRGQGG